MESIDRQADGHICEEFSCSVRPQWEGPPSIWVVLPVASQIEENGDKMILLFACLPSCAAKLIYSGGNRLLLLLADIKTQSFSLPKWTEEPLLSRVPWLGLLRPLILWKSSYWGFSLSINVAVAVLLCKSTWQTPSLILSILPPETLD